MAGKITKFSALVGMIAAMALLTLYLMAVPVFWETMAGKIFSIAWLAMALVTIVAFGQRFFERKSKRTLATVYAFNGTTRTASRGVKGPKQKGVS